MNIKNMFKQITLALLFVSSAAFSQVYMCPNANAQTYNTLDQVGIQEILQNNYTFVQPPSGSIAAATGVLTVTALDAVYANAYFYYPAGAWTGQPSAGWFYTSCSSTTTCLVYSNQYTTGVPTTPASPALVTTGLGAYTQATGAYVNGPVWTLPQNIMGANGKLYVEEGVTGGGASSRNVGILFGGQVVNAVGSTSVSATRKAYISNKGVTNFQTFSSESLSTSIGGTFAVDTTGSVQITERMFLTTATDFIVRQYINIQVTK